MKSLVQFKSFTNVVSLFRLFCGGFRSTTPQQWEDFSRYNKERADAEMANSRRLREANHHVIQQTDNDLATQQAATDYALRKRVHELERALDELRWQKQQVIMHVWHKLSPN